MFEQSPKEETLSIIKELEVNPKATQRVLSDKLGISLGKINYLLKALIKKGLIKVENFSTRPGKLGKIHYYLTARGIEEKLRLMQVFLKKKEAEYFMMKKACGELAADKAKQEAIKL